MGSLRRCEYGDVTGIDLLITDAGVPGDQLAALRAAGPDTERT
jgi:hypothetical protein